MFFISVLAINYITVADFKSEDTKVVGYSIFGVLLLLSVVLALL